MGYMHEGEWHPGWYTADETGRFRREPSRFRDRISADGASGHPAESDRYHLYVSFACPWANRTLIVRKLMGLEDALGISVVDPRMGEALPSHNRPTRRHAKVRVGGPRLWC